MGIRAFPPLPRFLEPPPRRPGAVLVGACLGSVDAPSVADRPLLVAPEGLDARPAVRVHAEAGARPATLLLRTQTAKAAATAPQEITETPPSYGWRSVMAT